MLDTKDTNIQLNSFTVKITADGKFFHTIQRSIIERKLFFYTHILTEKCLIKGVLRGIVNELLPDILKFELELLNFIVKYVKPFEPANEKIPMCMVILERNDSAKNIYELFYIIISVKPYKKTGYI